MFAIAFEREENLLIIRKEVERFFLLKFSSLKVCKAEWFGGGRRQVEICLLQQ
jgi:hypothetical protein